MLAGGPFSFPLGQEPRALHLSKRAVGARMAPIKNAAFVTVVVAKAGRGAAFSGIVAHVAVPG
jgi:hypothetical protein